MTDTSNDAISDERRHRFAAWVVALALGSVGAVLLEGWHDPGPIGPLPELAVVLAVCLVVAEVRPPSWLRFRDADVSVSWIFAYGLVLSDAGALAMVLIALSSVATEAWRTSWLKAAFNASQLVLSLAAGSAVLHATGQTGQLTAPDAPLGLVWTLSVLGAGAAIYVVNAALVSVAASILHGVAPFEVLTEGLRANLSGDGILIALSPVVVALGQRSLWLLPFVALAAIGVAAVGRMASSSQHAASHDPLTGLLNRRGFDDAAERLGADPAVPLAVALIDLDGFKPVNDTFGHAAGDDVLVETANRIRAAAPRGAIIARLGGDEFVVAWRGRTGAEVHRSGDVLLRAFDDPMVVDDGTVVIGASIGVAHTVAGLPMALEQADAAMYRAKSTGTGLALHDETATASAAPPSPGAP